MGPIDEAVMKGLAPVWLTRGSMLDEGLVHAVRQAARFGGLGLGNLSEEAPAQFRASQNASRPLVTKMLNQDIEIGDYPGAEIARARRLAENEKEARKKQNYVTFLHSDFPEDLRRAVHLAAEDGASAGLTVLPTEDHGFNLDRPEWEDCMSTRYGLPIRELPTYCGCGAPSNKKRWVFQSAA